jgi:hypothetical protein
LDSLCQKLATFQALPKDLAGLAACQPSELLEYVSKIEKDPFKVYEAVEMAYRENFLEKVVFHKYCHFFDNN